LKKVASRIALFNVDFRSVDSLNISPIQRFSWWAKHGKKTISRCEILNRRLYIYKFIKFIFFYVIAIQFFIIE